MSERINQHLHPLVGSNIRRLRKEQGLKATEVIAKLQCDGINVTTPRIFSSSTTTGLFIDLLSSSSKGNSTNHTSPLFTI